jgi:hypothetical protein
MREVFAEFTTTDQSAPDTYGDSGCCLRQLRQSALALRHEHYTGRLQHTIYLFARQPELGAQVFLHINSLPAGSAEHESELAFYMRQQKDFRLPAGQVFDASFLAPENCTGFLSHTAFRTRDGKYRRRVVHSFVGAHRAVLLVYSLDAAAFADSAFCNHVQRNLMLADTPCALAT